MKPPTNPVVAFLQTPLDAITVIEAAKSGLIPILRNRPKHKQREVYICDGALIVYKEHECSIRRWSDTRFWSSSRTSNGYIVYRERLPRYRPVKSVPPPPYPILFDTDEADDGIIMSSPSHQGADEGTLNYVYTNHRNQRGYALNGYMRKTFGIVIAREKWHVINYYLPESVLSGRLKRPTDLPELKPAVVDICCHPRREKRYRRSQYALSEMVTFSDLILPPGHIARQGTVKPSSEIKRRTRRPKYTCKTPERQPSPVSDSSSSAPSVSSITFPADTMSITDHPSPFSFPDNGRSLAQWLPDQLETLPLPLLPPGYLNSQNPHVPCTPESISQSPADTCLDGNDDSQFHDDGRTSYTASSFLDFATPDYCHSYPSHPSTYPDQEMMPIALSSARIHLPKLLPLLPPRLTISAPGETHISSYTADPRGGLGQPFPSSLLPFNNQRRRSLPHFSMGPPASLARHGSMDANMPSWASYSMGSEDSFGAATTDTQSYLDQNLSVRSFITEPRDAIRSTPTLSTIHETRLDLQPRLWIDTSPSNPYLSPSAATSPLSPPQFGSFYGNAPPSASNFTPSLTDTPSLADTPSVADVGSPVYVASPAAPFYHVPDAPTTPMGNWPATPGSPYGHHQFATNRGLGVIAWRDSVAIQTTGHYSPDKCTAVDPIVHGSKATHVSHIVYSSPIDTFDPSPHHAAQLMPHFYQNHTCETSQPYHEPNTWSPSPSSISYSTPLIHESMLDTNHHANSDLTIFNATDVLYTPIPRTLIHETFFAQ